MIYNFPSCHKCGSNSQVWINPITHKPTCHRVGCHCIVKETSAEAGKSSGSEPICAKEYKCPHCSADTLSWCKPYEPWSAGHWACGTCDSTYCDLPVQEKAPVHENVNTGEIVNLVKELLGILNETEESDSGTVFHPTTISSCRIMKIERLRAIFTELERIIYSSQ